MSSTSRRIIALALVAAVSGGCSSGDDESSGGEPATTTTSTDVPRTTADPEPDEAGDTSVSPSPGPQLIVRAEFTPGEGILGPPPVATDLADLIDAVEGVATTEGVVVRPVGVFAVRGELLNELSGASVGLAWPELAGGAVIAEGAAPTEPGQIALDRYTAERAGFAIGDSVELVLETGQQSFELVGIVTFGTGDPYAGSTTVYFAPEVAAEVLRTDGGFDAIAVGVADGHNVDDVSKRIEAILPVGIETMMSSPVPGS